MPITNKRSPRRNPMNAYTHTGPWRPMIRNKILPTFLVLKFDPPLAHPPPAHPSHSKLYSPCSFLLKKIHIVHTQKNNYALTQQQKPENHIMKFPQPLTPSSPAPFFALSYTPMVHPLSQSFSLSKKTHQWFSHTHTLALCHVQKKKTRRGLVWARLQKRPPWETPALT